MVSRNAGSKTEKEEIFSSLVLDKLLATFEEKKGLRNAYSLRQYAAKLEIDPTFLSKLMNNKKRLTFKTSLRLAKKLDIPIIETLASIDVQTEIPDQVFDPIAHWYYFAIIELRHRKDFQLDSDWIVSQLPITTKQATEAIEVLKSQKHIELENGNYRFNLGSGRWDGVNKTTDSKVSYQKEVSDLARKSLDHLKPDERHTYSLTIAASPDVLPQIRTKIRNLAEEFGEIAGKSKKKKVYQFQSHFFPLEKELLK